MIPPPKLIRQMIHTLLISVSMEPFPFMDLPMELQYYIIMMDVSIYPALSRTCHALYSLAQDQVIRQRFEHQYWLKYWRKITPGNRFEARYGQMGTIGRILSDEDIPIILRSTSQHQDTPTINAQSNTSNLTIPDEMIPLLDEID